MHSRAGVLTFLVFITTFLSYGKGVEDVGPLSKFEEKLESSLTLYTNSFVGWLEQFNDEHLGKSEIGKFLHYDEVKPKIEETLKQSRSMKKMGMALIPLIFHVGATSTWMLVTSLLAAKSVAIGLALLVFKIAVSSAKVASFFTALKGKSEWTPHYEHHDYPTYLDHAPTYREQPTNHHEASSHHDHSPSPPSHHELSSHFDHPPSHHAQSPRQESPFFSHPTYLDHPPKGEPFILPEWTPDSSPHYTGKSASYKKIPEPFTYTKNKE